MKQELKRNNFAFEAQIYQYVHVFDYPDHRKNHISKDQTFRN